MGKRQAWYLKRRSLYFFCFVTPPIGYMIIVTHLKDFEHDEKINYLFTATLMMAIWLLKFLPKNLNLYIWCFILSILIGNTLLKFLKRNK